MNLLSAAPKIEEVGTSSGGPDFVRSAVRVDSAPQLNSPSRFTVTRIGEPCWIIGECAGEPHPTGECTIDITGECWMLDDGLCAQGGLAIEEPP